MFQNFSPINKGLIYIIGRKWKVYLSNKIRFNKNLFLNYRCKFIVFRNKNAKFEGEKYIKIIDFD